MTKKIIGSKYFDNIPFPCSPAVQAGEWVFTSGLMATDWTSGILKEYQANQDFPNNNYAMSLQTEGIYQILSSYQVQRIHPMYLYHPYRSQH